MPTYAYACTACDHRFDAQQAFSDAALTECPQCQGRLRKLFGSVGVVFKGSGFYRTDSRSGSTGGGSSSSTSSTSTSSPSTTSDAGSTGSSSTSSSSTTSSSGSSSTSSSTTTAASA